MKRYVIMILMCLVTLSCEDKLAELEVVEFGAEITKDFPMPLDYTTGEFKIYVVSDGEFEAEVTEGEDSLSTLTLFCAISEIGKQNANAITNNTL